MKTIRQLVGRDLQWFQPNTFNRECELRDETDVAASLRFRSAFGSLATAESADGCWTFKRVGFWHTKATIRACGSDHELGLFRNNTWTQGGTLELADGRRYLANTNFWMTQYAFSTEAGTPLVTYRRIGGVLHLSSRVEIHPEAASLGELPWLVALGWYLTVMMHADAAAVVAVT